MTDLASETAQSSGPAVADATPAVLEGRYALGDLVGVGASAWVYRAEDLRTGRDVAVKLYPPGVGGPDRARQRSELALLAQLHHPNLVVLYDAGEDSGRAYLVMEFVDGPTLAEQLRAGPMQAGEVSRLGAELGYALAYVHSRGITHRDVKPANVLMGGRPMLTDFGIARLVDAARVTQTGYLIGTPAYLAPEQVSGGPVGMPADVYALGLVLLEALTGRREFDGDGPEAAFARLSRQPSVPEGLPGLTDLLGEMTALDPADRPTAGEVSERLRESASGLDDVPVMLPLLSGREERLPEDLPDRLPWSERLSGDASGSGAGGSGRPVRPTGDSGTKVLPMPPAPVVPEQRALRSMPMPPGPALAAGRLRRRRRVLAGALGATAAAAVVIGLVSSATGAAASPAPVAEVPVAAAPAVPPMAPTRPVPPVTPDRSNTFSTTGDSGGDSSSDQSSQDSKKAKQEAKKAKEERKKAEQASRDSGGSSSDSSSDSSGDSSSDSSNN